MKQTFASTTLAIALAASFQAWAASGTLSSSDVKFVQKAAGGGIGEVELGKLAQQKAVREETKQFATRMVEDHTKANDDLARVAQANSVNLPQEMDKDARKDMDKLQKLQGMDFDRAYMKHMVKDHKKDVREFRHEAKRGNDVGSFAQRTLPTLEEHLAMAEKTYDIAEASKHEGNRVVGSTH
jgi:putative membrane protein